MNWNFSFSTRLDIIEDEHGLRLPVVFSVGEREIQVRAYLDLGSTYCVLPYEMGKSLGLNVEAGQEVSLRTGGGPMPTFLHYATLTIGDLTFADVPICIAKYRDFDRCLIGRAGWLHKVRMNVIPYDENLFLNLHGQ